MYEDAEDASSSLTSCNVDTKDFTDALALLRSTDIDSADKLYEILDTSIEKVYGFERTLRARMPQKFDRNAKPRESTFAIGKSGRQDDATSRKDDNAAKKTANVSAFANDPIKSDGRSTRIFDNETEAESVWKSRRALDNAATNDYKLFKSSDEEEVKVDHFSETADIPRISIPDEGSGDGLFCKICNGAKLGPLILLECQDCQEVYHPLCHQPPVVDIDVYDPRIVWHCNNCANTVSADRDLILNEKNTKKFYRRNDTNTAKKSAINVDKSVKMEEYLSKNDTTSFEKTCPGAARETCGGDSGNHQVMSYSKDSSLSTNKMQSLSSNQLKKRIGSKLSVTRVVTKQS
ncbi:integrator complex subunit 12 [Megalopta genalis]|uniref:integrator complex subunit 12 n=1 Tax=Megalopta genalis TaxID=115081 RepID=UPI0014435480|nr:integrator complex subunit 12-like [Megalopta genalis]